MVRRRALAGTIQDAAQLRTHTHTHTRELVPQEDRTKAVVLSASCASAVQLLLCVGHPCLISDKEISFFLTGLRPLRVHVDAFEYCTEHTWPLDLFWVGFFLFGLVWFLFFSP